MTFFIRSNAGTIKNTSPRRAPIGFKRPPREFLRLSLRGTSIEAQRRNATWHVRTDRCTGSFHIPFSFWRGRGFHPWPPFDQHCSPPRDAVIHFVKTRTVHRRSNREAQSTLNYGLNTRTRPTLHCFVLRKTCCRLTLYRKVSRNPHT